MSWFFLGDVSHTRRRGIIMRKKHLCGETSLAKAIRKSNHYSQWKELETVRVTGSHKDYVEFEVWQKPPGVSPVDPQYTVFYVEVPVTEELLKEVCEGDQGRGTKRRWCRDAYD